MVKQVDLNSALDASAAPVRLGRFVPLLAVWGLVRVLPFCVVGPRSWAGSPSWSVFCGFLLLLAPLHLFPLLRLLQHAS